MERTESNFLPLLLQKVPYAVRKTPQKFGSVTGAAPFFRTGMEQDHLSG